MSRRTKYRFDDSIDYKLLNFSNSEKFITAKKLCQLIWAKEKLSGYDFGIQLIDAKTKKELDGDEEVSTNACVIVRKVYDDIDETNKRPKSGKTSAASRINPVFMARSAHQIMQTKKAESGEHLLLRRAVSAMAMIQALYDAYGVITRELFFKTCADAGLTREEALSNPALKPALDFYVAKAEAPDYGGCAVPVVSSATKAPAASTKTTHTYPGSSVDSGPIDTNSFQPHTTSVATTSPSDYSQPQFATRTAAPNGCAEMASNYGNTSYGVQPAHTQYSPPTSCVNPYTAWLQQYVQPGGHNVQTNHSSQEPYRCDACRVYFESSERLRHHERVSHSSSATTLVTSRQRQHSHGEPGQRFHPY